MSALENQIGGNHYKHFRIQPVEFVTANKLSFLQGCIIKRICRYNLEGGKGIQDLEKIGHEIDLIIELEGVGAVNRRNYKHGHYGKMIASNNNRLTHHKGWIFRWVKKEGISLI
jgi:hypothetical protein